MADLPVLALTDAISRTLLVGGVAVTNAYRTAMRIAENIPDEALIAEARRRGYYVLGRSDGSNSTGGTIIDDGSAEEYQP